MLISPSQAQADHFLFGQRGIVTKQTRDVHPTWLQCWANIVTTFGERLVF